MGLMAATGPRLRPRGFDVRVPELSRAAGTPSLRIFVDAVSETAVGANQLADVRWSAVFDDVELTAAEIARLGEGSAPARSAPAAAGSRSTAPTSTRPRPRSPNGKRRSSSPARRCCASRSGSRTRRSPAASRSTAAAGRPTCSPRRPTSTPNPRSTPKGFVGRAAQLPGRSARVARLPRRRRPRWLPRPRHGPRQDADDARPPARRGRATGPRW